MAEEADTQNIKVSCSCNQPATGVAILIAFHSAFTWTNLFMHQIPVFTQQSCFPLAIMHWLFPFIHAIHTILSAHETTKTLLYSTALSLQPNLKE